MIRELKKAKTALKYCVACYAIASKELLKIGFVKTVKKFEKESKVLDGAIEALDDCISDARKGKL
jgi:hypothetical protein